MTDVRFETSRAESLAYEFLNGKSHDHPFGIKADDATEFAADLLELTKFRAEYPGEYETWLAKRLLGIKDA